MSFFWNALSTPEWVYGFCSGLLLAAVFLLRADYSAFKRHDKINDQ